MIETIISWGFLLASLVVVFRLLSRYQQRRPPIKTVAVLLHALSVGISLSWNVMWTVVLYEPVLERFDVNIDGFMNINGLLTFAVIWSAVCLLSLLIVVKAKTLWGVYYRTLRITQLFFLLLPLLVVFVFLIVAGLK